MGEQLVGSTPTDTRGSLGTAPFTKVFWECLPSYLAMGMSEDAYFYGDPALKKAYRDAWKLKQEYKQNYDNWYAWLLGGYVYQAVGDLAPAFNSLKPKKPTPYLDKPFDMKPLADTPQEEDPSKTFITAWANKVNKKYERNT